MATTERRPYGELRALAAPLAGLAWEDRIAIANLLGLTIACCPGCGCYVGSPACHTEDQVDGLISAANESFGGDCTGCLDGD